VSDEDLDQLTEDRVTITAAARVGEVATKDVPPMT
jgi:hypothetical protein